MKKTALLPPFEDTMTLPQRVWGLIYLPIHVFVLPLFLNMLAVYLPGGMTEGEANIAYYAISFLFCLALMWKYLRGAFDRLCDNKILNFAAFISAYVAYFMLSLIVSALLLLILGDEFSNPNNEELASLPSGIVMGLGIFIAPVVEEILFRGALFGSLRRKNRIAAYVISMLVFGIYHIWQYALVSMDWEVLIYALQYAAAGYALAWLYEQTSCIWLPIFMHMAINLVAMILI